MACASARAHPAYCIGTREGDMTQRMRGFVKVGQT